MSESEFGRGFTYCIGLFLAHSDREIQNLSGNPDCSLWFNGAADHLFELVTPDNLDNEFKQTLHNWQTKCLNWRLNPCTPDDKEWAIKTAKDILRGYDTICGLETIEGEYE